MPPRPTSPREEIAANPNGAAAYGARSELARELTQAWHTRFQTRWAVVAGTTEIGEPMTFYSPDHPAPFTPGEIWSSGLTSLEEARRLGFIGICDTSDARLPVCEAWMAANAQGRRAIGDHHAALLPRPSRSRDQLEGLYRAAGEMKLLDGPTDGIQGMERMNLDLTGKLALVTGSTRGIGLATARGLAQMGAEVIVNGREAAAVAEAIAGIKQAVPAAKAHAAAFDLGGAEGCAGLIAQFPEVDILVNNLGIYEPRAFFDIGDEDWTRMFEVNVMSGVRLTRHYLKRMLDHKDWGRVVFVSSESAIFVPKEMVHYGFSKAAQLYVARGAAEQTKATNVTVNSVLPGPTWVEMAPVRLAARAKGMGTTVDDLVAQDLHRTPAGVAAAALSPRRRKWPT